MPTGVGILYVGKPPQTTEEKICCITCLPKSTKKEGRDGRANKLLRTFEL
jgi:hypothetical protein